MEGQLRFHKKPKNLQDESSEITKAKKSREFIQKKKLLLSVGWNLLIRDHYHKQQAIRR
jgi:hypothetical protein